MDRHELFPAMAHFHHAHAAALPIEHFVGGLTQNFFGHGRGAGGEIKDAHREILEAGAKNEDRAKIGEADSRVGIDREDDNAIVPARFSDAGFGPFRAEKENGRLRVCTNSHYRIVTAKPPNPARHPACEASPPGGGWRDIRAASGRWLTWPA
ncbi:MULTISPECIES: hypothetical protein [Paraburkholderia]|uniref:hypothetical protein n=1 Tax=Paraburkholderia TaxID=1822464 RepID=UPI001E3D4075|nr:MULTISPECIES: hypothetical protein [Paraburkholderia]MDR8399850.1 hypothetical protein [Paraburkholderia sp. USG1]